MSISINEFLSIDKESFDQTGAFNAILDIDSRLFIDPRLLQFATEPELKESYHRMLERFENILLILEKSIQIGDLFWRRAERLFTFPEVEGLCIGYSSTGTSGSGIGDLLRRSVLITAKEIIGVGIKDPRIFELIGLFEENIGPDRISDMIARIIADDLFNYTHRIFSDLEVKMERRRIRGKDREVVINPYNKQPIILVPKSILQALPMAYSWSDVDYVCQYNDQLREELNAIVGDTWKKATKLNKRALKHILLTKPELLIDLLSQYETKEPINYDFTNDPSGQYIWYFAAQEYTKEYPLDLKIEPNQDAVFDLVIKICAKFKDLIENNGLSSLLYDSFGKPKREEAAQKLFYGIADAYCEANDLDLSRETNGGRGPVDFKISSGYKSRVLVEAKLTSNTQLHHGFEIQIIEYQKAEKTVTSIYLIIDVDGGSTSRYNDLVKKESEGKAKGARIPILFYVDGKSKKSASRY